MASYPLKELVPQDRVIFTYFILTFWPLKVLFSLLIIIAVFAIEMNINKK